MEKKKPNFKRSIWHKYSKLGRGRKKKLTWRRPTGRDNKMREKRKGHPAIVSIGHRGEKNKIGTLKEKYPVKIMNAKDLEKVGKENIAVIGKVGKRTKIAIANKAKEMKIEIYNLNPKSFLKKNKIRKKEKKVESKKILKEKHDDKKSEIKKTNEIKENKK